MNGRVQDPIIGRMISADPFVPNPLNGQSYNRYSYVVNNPLSLVDPSGFDEEAPYDPDDRPLLCGIEVECEEREFRDNGNEENPHFCALFPMICGGRSDPPPGSITERDIAAMDDLEATQERYESGHRVHDQTRVHTTSDEPWTWRSVKELFQANELGRSVLEGIYRDPVPIISFTGAENVYFKPDGTEDETRDLTGRLDGSYDKTNLEIHIDATLSSTDAATTLFHEYLHRAGYDDEVAARVMTEQFAIAMGWPETGSGYRIAGRSVNVQQIQSDFDAIKEYHDPRPFKRVYYGETNVWGTEDK